MAGIRWVANATRLTGGASFLGKLAKARKLAAVSGWVYTAAETAVVLYYGDKISREIDERLERNELQEKVREAVDAMLKDPKGDGARERADAVTAAFRDYRDFTSRPLYEAEGLLTHRLGKLATDVKQNDDAFKRMQETVAKRGLDSLGGAARRLAESRNEKFQGAAGRAIDAYERSFAEAKGTVYREGVAINAIDDDEETLAALRGEAEPTGGSIFSRFGRGSARRNLIESVSDLPTDSRLAIYDQEAALWDAMAKAHSDDPLAAAYFQERARQLGEVRELDKNVVLGVANQPAPSADPEADPAKGFIDALEKLGATDAAGGE